MENLLSPLFGQRGVVALWNSSGRHGVLLFHAGSGFSGGRVPHHIEGSAEGGDCRGGGASGGTDRLRRSGAAAICERNERRGVAGGASAIQKTCHHPRQSAIPTGSAGFGRPSRGGSLSSGRGLEEIAG